MRTTDLTRFLSGDRFTVSYILSGDEKEARLRARNICFEQTVEFPEDLVPPGPIAEQIVGRIEGFTSMGGDAHRAMISYAVETTANDILQLLNVVFGNISLMPGIRVERLHFPDTLIAAFPGPRYGREGLRAALGVASRPLICTALKPMGLSPEELADQAFQFALGGVDLIKDDHGLADQTFCPFEERVARCAEAVMRANAQTDGKTLYLPNVTTSIEGLLPAARMAKDRGAGGLVICPGLAGIDAVRLLAADDSIALPLMTHPSFLGSFVVDPRNGFAHGALFGQIMRLAGSDMSVFPNYGGRFGFTRDECRAIAEACGAEMGGLKPIFPAPGGGMTTDRVKDMREVYGRQFVLLIGGGLHRHSADLARNAEYFLGMIDSL